ncbi:hypothetical protein OAP56_01490, partial [Rickettsiaceae bacterium]|nr:hypothetical protein [Rickettsiaceae bacterium]
SLRDSEIVLGAVAQKTAYSINMLTITDEYLKTVALSLQEAQKTVGSAGAISQDKLTVLQKNLDDKKAQVDLMIRTADFDGKSLLSGGAKKVDVQVGLSIADKFSVRVADISDGKLMRIGASESLNEYIGGKLGRIGGDKFDTQEKLDAAVTSRTNFTQEAAADLTAQNLADAITAVRDGNTSFIRIADEKLVPILNSKIVEQANIPTANAIAARFDEMFRNIASISGDPAEAAIVTAAKTAISEGIQAGDTILAIGNAIDVAIDAVPAVPAAAGADAQAEFMNAMQATNAVIATAVSANGGALVAADASTLSATIQTNDDIRLDAAGAIAEAVDLAIAQNPGATTDVIAAAVKAAAAGAAIDTAITDIRAAIDNGTVATGDADAPAVAAKIVTDVTALNVAGNFAGIAGAAIFALIDNAADADVVTASVDGFAQQGVSDAAMRTAVNDALEPDIRGNANVIAEANKLGDVAEALYRASLYNNTFENALPVDPVNIMNVTNADLATAIADAPVRAELVAILADNQATDLTTTEGRSLSQDVINSALNIIRGEQANISNQRSSVIEAADALRATTDVTQKSADSYLNTDYVLAPQEYNESVKKITSAISVLQGANKISDAVKQMLDSLAR